jgi:hypothetical protein
MSIKIDGSHITIAKGDTGVIRFIFTHKKQNVELGSRTFRLIIKKHKEDSDGSAIYDSSKIPANLTDNFILFPIDSATTDNEAGSYFWGLRVLAENYTNTIKEGIFTIEQGTYKGANV